MATELDHLIIEVIAAEDTVRKRLSRHGFERASIDDFVQEVYLRVVEKGIPREVRNIEAYVWTIARNVATDWVRTNRRRAALLEAALQLDPIIESVAAADEELYAPELIRRVESSLMKLPSGVRDVLLMKKVRNLSQKEIAEITGLSEHTVESYLNEGKTLLDRELAEQLDPEERSLVMTWLWPRRRSRDNGR